MTSTQFKLSKRDGLTRRITFADEPAWPTLAATIELHYGIPIDKVGVSYIDSDGDEVTLSSQEELQDFYQDFYPDFYQPSQAIKFVVQDLRSTRSADKALPEIKALPKIPPIADVPNTLGHLKLRSEGKALPKPPPSDTVRNALENEGLLSDVEGDWQCVPTIHGLLTPRWDSPHAFVEVADSDTSDISKGDEDMRDEGDDYHTVQSDFGNLTDNGKGQAREDGPPSINAAEAEPHSSTTASEAAAPAPHEEAVPNPVQLPHSIHIKHPTDSISNYVATHLNGLTKVITLHPEALRSIIQNASNEPSWTAQREAISEAAEELAHGARQAAYRGEEGEAGKRVADALGGIFKTLSQMTDGIIATVPRSLSSDPASAPAQPDKPTSFRSGNSSLGHPPSLGNRGPLPAPPAHRFGNPSSRADSDGGANSGPWDTQWKNPPHPHLAEGGGPPSPPLHPNPHGNGASLPLATPAKHGGMGSEPFGSWRAPKITPWKEME